MGMQNKVRYYLLPNLGNISNKFGAYLTDV